MSKFTLVVVCIYSFCSFMMFIGRITEMNCSYNKKYDPKKMKYSITIITLLFPAHFLPHLFSWVWTYDLRNLFLGKVKIVCQCNKCGKTHETFYQEFNKIMEIQ